MLKHDFIMNKGGAHMKGVIALMLTGMMLIGGCGTAANELAKISTPDRTPAADAVPQQTATPSALLISVSSVSPPAEDSITGTAGAVEGGAVVKVYDENTSVATAYSVTANADGSFVVNIGSDDFATTLMSVTATVHGKTESAPLQGLENIF